MWGPGHGGYPASPALVVFDPILPPSVATFTAASVASPAIIAAVASRVNAVAVAAIAFTAALVSPGMAPATHTPARTAPQCRGGNILNEIASRATKLEM